MNIAITKLREIPCPTLSSIGICFSFSSSANFRQSKYDLRSCVTLLQSCARDKNLKNGKQIHAYMLRTGLISSPLSATSLINMYSKCSHLNHAVSVFNYPFYECNVYAYNAIIAGFIACGLANEGLRYYRRMLGAGVLPDKFTFPCLIKGCCDVGEFWEIRKIHGLVFKLGLDLDLYVGSALVNTFLKFGLMVDAHEVFESLPEKDIALWNAMVNGYAQIGRFEEALDFFRRMGEKGVVPGRYTVTGILSVFTAMGDFDNGRAVHSIAIKMGYDSGIVVSNALIDMYGKCKCVGEALEIFKMMDEKDIFSWNSIIAVHQRCGDHDKTVSLFDKMLAARVRPDLVTITAVLPSCSYLSALMHGRGIHGYMIVNGLAKDGNCDDIDDVLMNNALLDMYAKCGSMRDAYLVFDKMSMKNLASWNIMIMGHGIQGHGEQALEMFSQMCKAKFHPDEVTFIGLLSACSHAGFVAQGRQYLNEMASRYGVNPTIEHYTCVIDMLGRAGLLEEAYEMALTLPTDASPVVWRALLAACRQHNNAKLAEVAAKRVFELDPEHCGSYVLMSNIYVEAGRYREVWDIRRTMRQQNVKKLPGCSWIELEDGVHAFITGDRSHCAAESIYAELQSLTAQEHGCVPNI